jgi:hypothetical protein
MLIRAEYSLSRSTKLAPARSAYDNRSARVQPLLNSAICTPPLRQCSTRLKSAHSITKAIPPTNFHFLLPPLADLRLDCPDNRPYFGLWSQNVWRHGNSSQGYGEAAVRARCSHIHMIPVPRRIMLFRFIWRPIFLRFRWCLCVWGPVTGSLFFLGIILFAVLFCSLFSHER